MFQVREDMWKYRINVKQKEKVVWIKEDSGPACDVAT